MLEQLREPKVVFWDLETIPNLKEVLKVYPKLGDYPGLTLKATITSIICFGYKVGDGKVQCVNAWDYPRWRKDINDDGQIVRAAYEVLKDADAIVTHNGKRFDWKFLQTRLLHHGLPPLHKIIHVDTCAIAKSNLYLFNNRLTTLGKFLVDEDKLENGGWDLWVRVADREQKAMDLMERYCKQDVALLAKVFKRMRPFISTLPNFNLFQVGDRHVCPTCSSTRLVSHGYRVTKTRAYKRYQCKDCGSVSRTDTEDRMPRAI